ncbi:4-hydroxy-tetrahydrodipicolinate synthase [Paenibacillus shirakamiensis]|uniref:4-hydroxy-tetrahydrodipicolinate synthase n=1 Tax=Paenibacillus shirakamiensis TaxID=1265935 RepID=A0ABS4JGV2_9BACL|nr:dihydrodipicolinate synthase family protein [Paenibacillus shirakamiensis]MBP2000955.1 4-hydroxy-tetrahydrodipicolinate synthase [Paenibacillus shirakamiensis]
MKHPSIDRVRRLLTGGLIPAVPVPRRADLTLDVKAHEAYATYLAQQNIAGVAVWAHTGRGLHLRSDERAYILHSWRKALSSDRLIIAGVGAAKEEDSSHINLEEPWLEQCLAVAQEAISWGADALMIHPPLIYQVLPELEGNQAIYDYHCKLAALGTPLVLFYLYPEAGGILYPPALLDRLLSIPEVVGIKMASLDRVMALQDISSHILHYHADKLLITGEDRMFGYSWMRGASSALVGMGAAYPNIQSDLIEAYQMKDYARFMELNRRVEGYAEVVFTQPMDKYITRMLWCLVIAGVIPEHTAFDIIDYSMSKEEIDALRQAIHTYEIY